MRFFDAHCHLPCDRNFSGVFANANTAGVVGCAVNSVVMDDWVHIVDFVTHSKNTRGAIGIHPWYVDTVRPTWHAEMCAILDENPDLMVGEIGLDKSRDDFESQEKLFISMVEIAIKYNRTINLHCVHAWDRVLEIFKTYRGKLPTVIAHGFDGNQNAIGFDADMYFSYSPRITNSKHKRARESLLSVPKNKILAESDGDNLLKTVNAASSICTIRADISVDDIFQNSAMVFFNGQIA